jgi:Tfp pilus assembly protein PilN
MSWRWKADMRPLVLDFKQQRRRVSVLAVVLLAGGLAVAAYAVSVERELAGKVQQAERKVASLEKEGERRAPPAKPTDDAALQLEVRQANEILRQLSLPWNDLFKAMESANEKEVAVLSIQPDIQRRVVRVSGEAKDLEAVLGYVERLQKSAFLSRVYLTSHEIRNQDPDRPVRFGLVANWVEKP